MWPLMHTIWICMFLMILLVSVAPGKKKENESVGFIAKEIKKLETSTSCSLQQLSKAIIQSMWLKNQTSDVTLLCALKFLETNGKQTMIWSLLGTSYDKRQQVQQADVCFKQASKISGKHTQFVSDWHFIGPFLIGKSEFDGDPVAVFGSIHNISKFRFDTKPQPSYISELVAGGIVKWSVVKQTQEQEMIQVKPNVDWNDLVSSLGSVAVTEWQGWVIGDFLVNEDKSQLSFQCLGVAKCFIGDTLIVGDLYHRNQYWFPVTLPRGYHQVIIPLRSKVSANFKFSVSKRPTFELLQPLFLPDIYKGYLPDKSYIAVPISNLMTNKWLKVIGVELVSQSDGIKIMPLLEQIVYNYEIAPGQTTFVSVNLGSENRRYDTPFINSCQDVDIEIKFKTSQGSENLKLSLRCRSKGSSFIFTFVDHDYSIQHAAAIEPIGNCKGKSCPVVLTLHGTTVPPQNQADSYKKMVKGEYQFGVKKMWLLAPTRHGAHNWEGPGALTAMSALGALQEMTEWHDCFEVKADSHRVLFAGHSMGGHGAWHLATHFPDRAIGLISLAGWIKKEEYGDSNSFFRHDIATSHTSPEVKAVTEACIAENDVDKHVTNLKGIPVLARIGANDRTVHPLYVRRMVRLLREAKVDVTYSELPGLEHWWWDTKETNDGGCVNDAQIRKFMAEVVSPLSSDQSESCSSDTEKCEDDSGSANKYKSSDQDTFTLVVVNPAFGEGLKGVSVIQQIIPFRTSLIQIRVNASILILVTQNVQCLQVNNRVRNRPIIYEDIRVYNIDGNVVEFLKNPGDFPYTFCRSSSSNGTVWEYIPNIYASDKPLRLPETYGPAKRVAERDFVIVVGTKGDQSTSNRLLQHAVYIANQFFLTSNTIVPIIEDRNFDPVLTEENFIVIGNPEENLVTSKHLNYLQDLKYVNSTESGTPRLHLGKLCTYENSRTGLLTLAPNYNSLVLILMGLSPQGLADVVNLATPTIPPMARSPFSNLLPDFVVTGPDVDAKGPGGFLCTGFWDNHWRFLPATSSCVCVDRS